MRFALLLVFAKVFEVFRFQGLQKFAYYLVSLKSSQSTSYDVIRFFPDMLLGFKKFNWTPIFSSSSLFFFSIVL